MHINLVKVDDFLVSFDIENVETTKNGKREERILAVAKFTKDGAEIHKIYNLGNFDYCAKLLDNNFAISEAKRLIERANVSKHSPFRN